MNIRMPRKTKAIYLLIAGLMLLTGVGWYVYVLDVPYQPDTSHPRFNGQRTYPDVKTQVAFGSRVPGTDAHAEVQKWI